MPNAESEHDGEDQAVGTPRRGDATEDGKQNTQANRHLAQPSRGKRIRCDLITVAGIEFLIFAKGFHHVADNESVRILVVGTYKMNHITRTAACPCDALVQAVQDAFVRLADQDRHVPLVPPDDIQRPVRRTRIDNDNIEFVPVSLRQYGVESPAHAEIVVNRDHDGDLHCPNTDPSSLRRIEKTFMVQ